MVLMKHGDDKEFEQWYSLAESSAITCKGVDSEELQQVQNYKRLKYE
jgi:hypothetical protein